MFKVLQNYVFVAHTLVPIYTLHLHNPVQSCTLTQSVDPFSFVGMVDCQISGCVSWKWKLVSCFKLKLRHCEVNVYEWRFDCIHFIGPKCIYSLCMRNNSASGSYITTCSYPHEAVPSLMKRCDYTCTQPGRPAFMPWNVHNGIL